MIKVQYNVEHTLKAEGAKSSILEYRVNGEHMGNIAMSTILSHILNQKRL